MSDTMSNQERWRHALACHLHTCLDSRLCGSHECSCQLPSYDTYIALLDLAEQVKVTLKQALSQDGIYESDANRLMKTARRLAP